MCNWLGSIRERERMGARKEAGLTCNPHTKLYKKRTDQRIYFCRGRDEIVRIGGHWQE